MDELELTKQCVKGFKKMLMLAQSVELEKLTIPNIPVKNLEVVVNALEKQIPKKLKQGVCPNCDTNNDIIIKHLGNPQAHKEVYCWNCGQRLDWSEVK